ncbi:MAG TPA: protein phosphatase 2C domain-containing protein [Gemmataceae bacterium]|nr:protein phosphatase 2C domain-containing protein [Gemmataceae bacterium]
MIAYLTHTEPGGHDENQDYVDMRSLSGHSPYYVCAVADGQGGQAGAARAVAIACQSCLDKVSSFRTDKLLSPSTWSVILRDADRAVADAAEAGYTTLIAFCLTETLLCGASSGDSAVAVLNAREPPRILTKHQMKNPPVGSRGAIFVPFSIRLIHPWTLLAMTDGVWKYAGWDNIFAAASEGDGEAIIHKLRAKAALPRTGGLQDDFTLVVFQG